MDMEMEQAEDGGLAAPRCADQRDTFAGLNLEAEPVQDILAVTIAE